MVQAMNDQQFAELVASVQEAIRRRDQAHAAQVTAFHQLIDLQEEKGILAKDPRLVAARRDYEAADKHWDDCFRRYIELRRMQSVQEVARSRQTRS